MGSILNPLYYAVSWVMVTFHSLLGYIFGKDSNESIKWSLSIIGLVIVIRIILIPLFVKQIKSQRALTALQPHMKDDAATTKNYALCLPNYFCSHWS